MSSVIEPKCRESIEKEGVIINRTEGFSRRSIKKYPWDLVMNHSLVIIAVVPV